MENKMIRLENIGITFHAGTPDENTALKNINLTINKGDFITVIGSNGAGKTILYSGAQVSSGLSPLTIRRSRAPIKVSAPVNSTSARVAAAWSICPWEWMM